MKASETDFRFPVFAFPKKLHDYGGYSDLEYLRWSHRKYHFEENLYSDMELIDADYRRWIVRDAYLILETAPRRWWHIGPIKPHVWKHLEMEVEEIEAVSFTMLRDRICSVRIDGWRDAVAKGKGPMYEEDLNEQLDNIRATTNAEELYDADTMDGFDD